MYQSNNINVIQTKYEEVVLVMILELETVVELNFLFVQILEEVVNHVKMVLVIVVLIDVYLVFVDFLIVDLK